MEDQDGQTHRRKRERSPNYPGLSLATAIDRANVVYKKDGRSLVAPEVMLSHWGYKPKTGPGLVTLAALKSFGLLEGTAKSGFKLTPLALRIILDERPDSSERKQAIREAALKPEIHEKTWTKYEGQLPSDAQLRYDLRNQMGFTDGGADDFIRKFKATIDFAELTSSDNLGGQDAPEEPDGGEGDMSTQVKAPIQQDQAPTKSAHAPRVVNLPLSPTAWAVLQVPAEMGEQDWTQLLALLNAMKPGLVGQRVETQPPDPS